jgi:hypothetical protein
MFDYRGVCVPVWGADMMAAEAAIRRAAKWGANYVQLVTHHYVSTAAPYIGGPIYRGANTASLNSVAETVKLAHSLGLKVMLKPHVDWDQGGWRGWFYHADDESREAWWQEYHAMIGEYTALAIALGVEMICIGCEFGDINKDPHSAKSWQLLISNIRSIYKGMLTYAANWGYEHEAEYNRPGLAGVWEQLDIIGIDAYYPLSTKRSPTLNELRAGWRWAANPWWEDQKQNHVDQLWRLAAQQHKPVIFTEIGYPFSDYAAKNPGGEPESGWAENDALQANCFRAVFDVWGPIEWMRGAFFWQDGPTRNSHSFYMRSAGEVLKQRYKKFASLV